jgi:ketosteroid isomerase-like protein
MATPHAAQDLEMDHVKVGMASTNALFNDEVFGKRNFTALDDIYTSNARILPPGSPMISGRDAITRFWTDMIGECQICRPNFR